MRLRQSSPSLVARLRPGKRGAPHPRTQWLFPSPVADQSRYCATGERLAFLCLCMEQVVPWGSGNAHHLSLGGKSRMALRTKIMTKAQVPEEPAQEVISQRRRPENG